MTVGTLQPGELLSYKRKLKMLDGHAMAEFIEDLLKRGRLVPELFQELASAVLANESIPATLLGRVIATTQSSFLLSSWETRIAKDPLSMVAVMRDLPCKDIEEKLCECLYSLSGDQRTIYYRPILEALGAYGSEHSLETVQSLLFDLDPELKTASVIRDSLIEKFDDGVAEPNWDEAMRLINYRELNAYKEMLVGARDELRQRGKLARSLATTTSADQSPARRALERGGEALRHARENLRIGRLKDAARDTRVAVEAYGKAVWWSEQAKDTLDNKTLEPIKNALKERKLLPEMVEAHFNTVQAYSTFGAHDKATTDTPLTSDLVLGCISAAEQVAHWAAKIIGINGVRHDIDIEQ